MVVADDLRDAIAHGRYQPGDRIPSANELAQQYEVSPVTVQAAFKELKNEGILEGRQGAGTFVTSERMELLDAVLSALADPGHQLSFSGPVDPEKLAALRDVLLAH